MAIEDVQTNLRIPSNIKEKLQASADAAGRSLSAEAAYRLAMAYELETDVTGLHAMIAALQSERQSVLNDRDRQESKIRSSTREVAKLEQQLSTIKDAREADIAAATKYLNERCDLLAEKASLFEQEARAQRETAEAMTRMNKLLGLFLQEVAGMVSKKSDAGKEMMRLIAAVGGAVTTGNYLSAVGAAAELVEMAKQKGLIDPENKLTHTAESVQRRLEKQPGLLD